MWLQDTAFPVYDALLIVQLKVATCHKACAACPLWRIAAQVY